MKNANLILQFNDFLLTKQFEEFANCLADDFVCTGVTPEPIPKAGYVAMLKTMSAAFSDFSNNPTVTKELDNVAFGTLQVSGTHVGALDLGMMGMPIIPPTHKSFKLGEDKFEAIIKDGKIAHMKIILAEGGGFPGIFSQLGIEMSN